MSAENDQVDRMSRNQTVKPEMAPTRRRGRTRLMSVLGPPFASSEYTSSALPLVAGRGSEDLDAVPSQRLGQGRRVGRHRAGV